MTLEGVAMGDRAMVRRLAAAAFTLALCTTTAEAQGAAQKGGLPLPGGGTTSDLTVPGAGGVAGTGLGSATGGSGDGTRSGAPSRDTGAAGVPGTGMSVKGPAGEGIEGQGISGGIGTGTAPGAAETAGAGK